MATHGTTGIPPLNHLFNVVSNDESVYEQCKSYLLKVILLEYINEPRFRQTQSTSNEDVIAQNSVTKLKNKISKFSKYRETSTYTRKQETKVLQYVCKLLYNHLKLVTSNTIIQDDLFRSCLLSFSNDYYLDSHGNKLLRRIEIFEDLINFFIQSTNHELNRKSLYNPAILHEITANFIDLICGFIVDSSTFSKALVYKLSEFKAVAKHSKVSKPIQHAQDLHHSYYESTSIFLRPTFRLEEIKSIHYYASLFNLNLAELQSEILKLENIIQNQIHDLEILYTISQLQQDQGMYRKENFRVLNDYYLWKEKEVISLESLIKDADPTTKPPKRNYNVFIPERAEDVFLRLLLEIFKKEDPIKSDNAIIFSPTAKSIIDMCSKLWRLDLESTKKSLMYSAFNLAYFETGGAHNINNINKVLEYLQIDPNAQRCWNELDIDCWIVNLNHTFNQCIKSLSQNLSELFSTTIQPAFSETLTIYYNYIDSNEIFKNLLVRNCVIENIVLKMFQPIINKQARTFFFHSLKTKELSSFFELNESLILILSSLQRIEKRYPKPLLEMLDLPKEASRYVFRLLGENINDIMGTVRSKMLQNFKSQKNIPFDELQCCWQNVRHVKNTYESLFVEESFPFGFEDYFFPDLLVFVENLGNSVMKACTALLLKDEWTRINDTTKNSLSTMDITKMVFEFSNILLESFDLTNLQCNLLITRFLEHVTSSFSFFCNEVFNSIKNDLEKDYTNENTETSETSGVSSRYKRSSVWLMGEVKNALSSGLPDSSSSSKMFKDFEFKSRSCVMLNDIADVSRKLCSLEDKFKPQNVSNVLNHSATLKKSESDNPEYMKMLKKSKKVYTVRIVDAEKLPTQGVSTFVTLVDPYTKKDYKTQVSKTSTWDEEIELEVSSKNDFITLGVWSMSDSKKILLSSAPKSRLLGRCSISLSSSSYNKDGLPKNVSWKLDTHGYVNLQISLEREVVDPLFYFGRCHRNLDRLMAKSVQLFVNKFSQAIDHTLSRATLKFICGNAGTVKPNKHDTNEVLLPLFDYLNRNLEILAQEFTPDLLNKTILECWLVVLNKCNDLLLPKLYSGNSIDSSNIINKIKTSKFNHSIGDYGRALTTAEMEAVFEWLKVLSVEFFHNKGQGPPLESLHNEKYMNLLLVPLYYEKSVRDLQLEVERFIPQYVQHLKVNYHVYDVEKSAKTPGKWNSSKKELHSLIEKSRTIARSKTIMGYASKSKKGKRKSFYKYDDPDEKIAMCSDIILRILIAKGDVHFVRRMLDYRAKVAQSFASSEN